MPLSALVLSSILALSLGAGAPELKTAHADEVTAALPEDPAVAQALAPATAIIRKEFSQVLVQCPAGIPRGRRGEESPLGYWVADRMRERASLALGRPIPFALTNSGGLRADLPPGPVRVSDITELMPFDNELVVAEYSGRELAELIRAGLIRKNGEPCSGVRVRLEGRPERPVLSITWEDGRPLDPEETFLVASTDYLLSSGDGLPTQRRSMKTLPTGIQIRQLLLDACEALGKQGQPLTSPGKGRYTFAPGMLEALRDRRIAW